MTNEKTLNKETNARLIAVAPQLLIRLIELADLVENNLVTGEVSTEAWTEELALAVSIIKTAQGE